MQKILIDNTTVIKRKYFRTYIIKITTPKRVVWYAGKHESYFKDPKKDPYKGSGKILNNIYRKYNPKYSIRWFKCHGSLHLAFEHEKLLISKLKEKHKDSCINIALGGQGGEGVKWSTAQKIKHRCKLNSKATKEKMKSSQKKAQNTLKRKSRQSEIMKAFYSKGGATKVALGVSKAQRKALHWYEPLKLEIYNLWLDLGKPKQGQIVKALKGKYDCTGSSIKNLIYEFKNYGYLQGK